MIPHGTDIDHAANIIDHVEYLIDHYNEGPGHQRSENPEHRIWCSVCEEYERLALSAMRKFLD